MSQDPGHSLEALRFFSKLFVAIGKNLQRTFVGRRGGGRDTHPPCSLCPVNPSFFLNKVSFVPVSTVSSQKQWPGCP